MLKSTLTNSFQDLVELIRRLGFGRLEKLQIRNGLPVLSPLPIIVREIKFGAPREEQTEIGDYMLKDKVRELIDYIRWIEDGVITVLEIQNGLPFRMTIREEEMAE